MLLLPPLTGTLKSTVEEVCVCVCLCIKYLIVDKLTWMEKNFPIYLITFIWTPVVSSDSLISWLTFWKVFDSHLYYILYHLSKILHRAVCLLGSNFLNDTCLFFSLVNTEINKSLNCLRMLFCSLRNGVHASWKPSPLYPNLSMILCSLMNSYVLLSFISFCKVPSVHFFPHHSSKLFYYEVSNSL